MISASTSPVLRRPRRVVVALGLLAALTLGACGGDSAAPAGTTAGTGGAAVEGTGGETTGGETTVAGEGAAVGEVSAADIAALEDRIAALEAAVVRLTGGTATGDAAGVPAVEEPVTDATEPVAEAPAADPPHWNYEEAEAWGSLSPEYAACATGTQQSPINLVEPEVKDLENATFDYLPSTATIVNNGHTVQVNLEAGGSMWLDGVEYRLVQFHFHGPSEHTVGGESYPLEIHFVHKAADGALAVLGVLVEVGEADPAWSDIVSSLPTEIGVEAPLPFDVDADALMPEIRAAYRYSGSLTTPPCTEGVEWQVMIATGQMSGEQIDAIRAQFAEENNRPVQAIGDRELDVDLSW